VFWHSELAFALCICCLAVKRRKVKVEGGPCHVD
jgi:hypothetical protein